MLNSFVLLTISRPLSANNSTKKPDSNHYAREKKEEKETLPQEKTGNGVRPLTLDSEYETEKGGRERGRSFHPLGVPITLYLKDHSLALTDSWNASTASKTGRQARFEDREGATLLLSRGNERRSFLRLSFPLEEWTT